MNQLRLETVLISSLSLDPSNARKHDAKNLASIAGSLKLFGQRKPIVVSGANVVVADPWANQLELKQIYDISLGEINGNKKVDSLIVAVGHNEFRSKSPEELRSFCKGSNPVLADVKSIYKREDLIKQGFSVFRL